MPMNQGGKFFSNPARGRMQDSMDAMPQGDDSSADDGQSITVQMKPDGSICTIEGGEEAEHPDLNSAIAAIQQKFGSDDQGDAGDENEEQY